VPTYQFPGHIQDADQFEKKKSQTHTERFSQLPLGSSEKPKTPTANSQKEAVGSPIGAISIQNQQELFESYVPQVDIPKENHQAPPQETSAQTKPKTPQSSVLPSVVKKPASHASLEDNKPLHKRIDREEYNKDVQNFYGATHHAEAPSKISKLIEELDNQKRVMEKLDRKQKDVLANSKIENRKTAAQMIDKFIQTV
jgi:hypothetical protein